MSRNRNTRNALRAEPRLLIERIDPRRPTLIYCRHLRANARVGIAHMWVSICARQDQDTDVIIITYMSCHICHNTTVCHGTVAGDKTLLQHTAQYYHSTASPSGTSPQYSITICHITAVQHHHLSNGDQITALCISTLRFPKHCALCKTLHYPMVTKSLHCVLNTSLFVTLCFVQNTTCT